MDEVLYSVENRVALLRINRPKQRNALNRAVMTALVAGARAADADPNVGAIVITGDDAAFAAGADISEMQSQSAIDMLLSEYIGMWDVLAQTRKPLIAAVSGWCLGGGCELAMLCDIMIASESAQFGQPEINIGVIPGAGGTQRLTRAVGKSLAMEMVLNGRVLKADEALRTGLVSRVWPMGEYLAAALELASQIAARAPLGVRLGKQAVNAAFEMPLSHGIADERAKFQALFASEDQKEGMAAFLAKRKPEWKGK